MKIIYPHIFLFFLFFLFSNNVYCQYWNKLSSGLAGDFISTGVGNKLIVFNNKLIVGGYIKTAGGLPVNHIAAWDGSSWESLNDGLNGAVYDMIIWNNKLIVTGSFTNASGIPCNNVAAWNGNDWESLGKGIFNIPNASTVTFGVGGRSMAIYNDELVVTGEFDSAGTIKASNIASWNGTNWTNPFGRIRGFGSKLFIDETNLYIGGIFDTVAFVKAKNIARWDGSGWFKMSNGISLTSAGMYTNFDQPSIKGGVTFIDKYNNKIIAGGYGVPVITYTGTAWQSLSYGSFATFGEYITHAEVINSQIIAGGPFQETGPDGLYFYGITKLNNNLWEHFTLPQTTGFYLGSGIYAPDYINDIEEYNGDLYITGCFNYEYFFYPYMLNGIGRLNGTVSIREKEIDENKNTRIQLEFYPNPVKDHLTFRKVKGVKGELEIYNIQGTRVLSCKLEETINISKLVQGSYIIRIKFEKFEQRGIFIKE